MSAVAEERSSGGERSLPGFSAPLLLCLAVTAAAPGQAPMNLEEAARRLAVSAASGPREAFLAALDADGILQNGLGRSVWADLTDAQRAALRSAVRERFAGMLAPPRPVAAGVAWSAALPADAKGAADVVVGLRLEEKTLKTRWRMRGEGSRAIVGDVILSDPGISLARAAVALLGPRPAVAHDRMRRARAEILPPLAVAAALALAALLAARRLERSRRRVLYLAAAVPALFFGGTGALAAIRVASEKYAVSVVPAAEPWRRPQDLAVAAERDGRAREAEELSARALAAGAPPGPSDYELGFAARERGDAAAARAFFERALAAPEPAPGAARELAGLDTETGKFAQAEQRIASYLETAGPDPDALSLQAVIETNLGKTAEAVASIARARALLGDSAKGAELEAKIRARAADPTGAVAALRAVAGIDREALRSDPAYMPIATDPVWVKFLNER